MGTVIQLKKQINNSYFDLKNSVEEKLILVEEKIKNKLSSKVDLVQKISDYHIEAGGKRLRALLALETSKLCGYLKGGRDINLAACVELIHGATLLHDDVIDNDNIRRGKKTPNFIWGNHSSILTGDYLLSRCFEMMVEDGNLEILKLLSSTSAKIAQGEILQLQHKGEIDMLEETYLKIISFKTAVIATGMDQIVEENIVDFSNEIKSSENNFVDIIDDNQPENIELEVKKTSPEEPHNMELDDYNDFD